MRFLFQAQDRSNNEYLAQRGRFAVEQFRITTIVVLASCALRLVLEGYRWYERAATILRPTVKNPVVVKTASVEQWRECIVMGGLYAQRRPRYRVTYDGEWIALSPQVPVILYGDGASVVEEDRLGEQIWGLLRPSIKTLVEDANFFDEDGESPSLWSWDYWTAVKDALIVALEAPSHDDVDTDVDMGNEQDNETNVETQVQMTLQASKDLSDHVDKFVAITHDERANDEPILQLPQTSHP